MARRPQSSSNSNDFLLGLIIMDKIVISFPREHLMSIFIPCLLELFSSPPTAKHVFKYDVFASLHHSTAMIISFLLSLTTLILLRFIYKAVWIPFRVQHMMHSQGITGPSYKIIYGTTKESMMLRHEAMTGPMELSHDIFPKIQPQFYQWMKLHGKW